MIELDLTQLPEGEEVLGILTNEKVPLNYWVDLAVSNFRPCLSLSSVSFTSCAFFHTNSYPRLYLLIPSFHLLTHFSVSA